VARHWGAVGSLTEIQHPHLWAGSANYYSRAFWPGVTDHGFTQGAAPRSSSAIEFWASDDANSGIFIRCQEPTKITDRSCYEVNIFDQRKDPTYGTGGIVHFVEWSEPDAQGRRQVEHLRNEITAKGRQIIVILNGQKTAELNNGLFAEGPFTLQHGEGVIKFRKVAVKPL
jgi:3-keto-disaccharide hydrolase